MYLLLSAVVGENWYCKNKSESRSKINSCTNPMVLGSENIQATYMLSGRFSVLI